MGLFKMSRGDVVVPGNPVPYRFTIERTFEGPQAVAAEIRYPDATNYEGRKICVYRGLSDAQLRAATVLDPHFRDEPLSPVARFEPTSQGWELACQLARTLPAT